MSPREGASPARRAGSPPKASLVVSAGRKDRRSNPIASAVAGNNRDRATLWVVIIMGISLVTMVLMNLLTGRQSGGKREAKA